MGAKSAESKSSAGPVCAPVSLRWFEFLLSLWHGSSDRLSRRRVLFLVCLLSMCATAALMGAVPTHQYGHDIFTLLENGWRVVNGQRPHVDYASPWGPVMFLVVGLGLTLSG
jgi:hypothetical protein